MSDDFSDRSAAAHAPPACVCSPAPDVSIKLQHSSSPRVFPNLPRCFAARLINDSSAAPGGKLGLRGLTAACVDLHPLLVSQLRRTRGCYANHTRLVSHAGMLMNPNRRVGVVLHGPRVKNGVRGENGERFLRRWKYQDTPTKPER